MSRFIRSIGKVVAISVHQLKEGWKEGKALNRFRKNKTTLVQDTHLYSWGAWMDIYWDKRPHFPDYKSAADFYRKHRKAYEDKKRDEELKS